MPKLIQVAVAVVGYALALAIFPISAAAQPEPVEIDNFQIDARKPYDCRVTSERYGKNGSIGGKCKGDGSFQIRILCYESNSTSSDSSYTWGGRASAPKGASLAVCRGSYPYMLSDQHVKFWRT
ncbi:hypothetical protein [Nocardia brasiliensis]|uniref:hypothetical protein n=1 Tax=Nocardia brasiliensis TaxID=37326 RepID=UPI002458A0FB|nr:hypothetical protein [Nocardia brasiliensis]